MSENTYKALYPLLKGSLKTILTLKTQFQKKNYDIFLDFLI
jgi:hypothetical protein